jgi:hypothetical protein
MRSSTLRSLSQLSAESIAKEIGDNYYFWMPVHQYQNLRLQIGDTRKRKWPRFDSLPHYPTTPPMVEKFT